MPYLFIAKGITIRDERWMFFHWAFLDIYINRLITIRKKIMANIKKMEMAQAIFANENISVEKAFFGLKTKLTYKPTGCSIEPKDYDFAPDMGEKMLKVIKAPAGKLEAAVANAGKIATTPIGHFHLEVCQTTDGQWAAMQMFRFQDFKLQPETDIIYLEGKDVQLIMGLL